MNGTPLFSDFLPNLPIICTTHSFLSTITNHIISTFSQFANSMLKLTANHISIFSFLFILMPLAYQLLKFAQTTSFPYHAIARYSKYYLQSSGHCVTQPHKIFPQTNIYFHHPVSSCDQGKSQHEICYLAQKVNFAKITWMNGYNCIRLISTDQSLWRWPPLPAPPEAQPRPWLYIHVSNKCLLYCICAAYVRVNVLIDGFSNSVAVMFDHEWSETCCVESK